MVGNSFLFSIMSMHRNHICLIVALFVAVPGFSQLKKVEKLLGQGFQPVPIVQHGTNDLNGVGGECKVIPSTTYDGDTSGIVFNNEYVLFRNYTPFDGSVPWTASYVKTQSVSNAEYQEFRNWVRDSIARECIYIYLDDSEDAFFYLNMPKKEKEVERISGKSHARRKLLREGYALNWETKFSYQDPEILSALADMYFVGYERFYGYRDFDTRKLNYRYVDSTPSGQQLLYRIPTLTYPDAWALNAPTPHDELSVLGQVYEQQFPEQPALCYSGMQARAFCHWKAEQLQKQADQRKLPYRIIVTLPLNTELHDVTPEHFTVPQRDYTSQWKITVDDYRQFMTAVRDSFIVEQLYEDVIADDEEAARLLNYTDSYFDEGVGAMEDFDPSMRSENRYFFPLNHDEKILKKYAREFDSLVNMNFSKMNYFCYYWRDMPSFANPGKVTTVPDHGKDLYLAEWDEHGQLFGRTLVLDNCEAMGQHSGVRSHENFSKFYHREILDVRPQVAIDQQQADALVQGISYEQALAYYHWKHPIHKIKPSDNWQDFVLPDAAQFEQIQRGESIVVDQHIYSLPTPTFRYVVTFVPN